MKVEKIEGLENQSLLHWQRLNSFVKKLRKFFRWNNINMVYQFHLILTSAQESAPIYANVWYNIYTGPFPFLR